MRGYCAHACVNKTFCIPYSLRLSLSQNLRLAQRLQMLSEHHQHYYSVIRLNDLYERWEQDPFPAFCVSLRATPYPNETVELKNRPENSKIGLGQDWTTFQKQGSHIARSDIPNISRVKKGDVSELGQKNRKTIFLSLCPYMSKNLNTKVPGRSEDGHVT